MNKSEIVSYITYLALEIGSFTSQEICDKFSISLLKFYRCLSAVKNMLYESEIYHIQIKYKRSLKKYIVIKK